VKNITVSVSEEVYRRACVKAAERDTSVSALVKQFLAGLGGEESDLEKGKRLEEEVLATIRRIRGGHRLTRDAVHRRRALR
jgi:predicted CopG family antitoxin